jgi:hypothetical protein
MRSSWTAADAWKDEDGDGAKDTAEAEGPFTLLAASEFGQGRVIVVSDNAFHQGMFGSYNMPLMMNLLAWLSRTGS